MPFLGWWHGPIQRVVRQVAERPVKEGKPDKRIDQGFELLELVLCFLPGTANNRRQSGHDEQFIFVAAENLHPRLHGRIVIPCVLNILLRSKDYVAVAGCDTLTNLGCSRLDKNWSCLG